MFIASIDGALKGSFELHGHFFNKLLRSRANLQMNLVLKTAGNLCHHPAVIVFIECIPSILESVIMLSDPGLGRMPLLF